MTSKVNNNPVVAHYVARLSVGGPGSNSPPCDGEGKVLKGKRRKFSHVVNYLNESYGFEDGNCNFFDPKTERFLPKPCDDEKALNEAHRALNRHEGIRVLISVHKDGTKTYKLLDYEGQDSTVTIDSFRGEYRFLSNFWPSPFSFKGVHYPTVEHFYQAMKRNSKWKKRNPNRL